MAEKTLEKYDIVVALIVKVTEGFAKSVGANVLFDSTSLSSFLEHFTKGVHFNVPTFPRGEDILISVKIGRAHV